MKFHSAGISLFLLLAVTTSMMAEDALSPELRQALVDRRESIKKWVITCPSGPYEGSYSHTEGTCHQGDSTMFAGLACLAATLAGDTETADARCADVANSQGPDGRWYRGPSLVEQPYPGTFSRDQSRGVFAYLLAKGHVSQNEDDNLEAYLAATHWLDWVIHKGPNKICPENQTKCNITAGIKNLFFNVYRHIGALPRYTRRREDQLIRSFYRSKWYLRWGFRAEIPLLVVETRLRGKWYPVHLKASSLLLYRVQNLEPDGRVRNRGIARNLGRAARRIHRFNLDNPLYDFLRNGIRLSLVKKVLERCPAEKPTTLGNLHDWAWQRHTSEQAWENSDGHDSVYLINLILARADGKLNW